MTITTHRAVLVLAASAILTIGVAGCGSSGPNLSSDQKQVSAAIHHAGLSSKDADCIAGKLTGRALDEAGGDANFSELSGHDGGEVAAAYSDCTGRNFREIFHYNPTR